MAKPKPTIDKLKLKRVHEINEVRKWFDLIVDAVVEDDNQAFERASKEHRNAMARLYRASRKLTALQRATRQNQEKMEEMIALKCCFCKLEFEQPRWQFEIDVEEEGDCYESCCASCSDSRC